MLASPVPAQRPPVSAAPPVLPARASVRGSSGTAAASAADLVVHDLCDKRIALLGESPTHGFGNTMRFKVEIVQRLVDECHFDAFFIESGAYDFLNIQRILKAGQTITQPMIAAAIGGLWANGDVAPLIPFLADRAQRGVLVLGGLDDQLGRGTYAQNQMPADLVTYLGGEDRARCLAVLQRHMLWQYANDSPYSAKDKALILACLNRVEARLPPASAAGDAVYRRAMIENLKRTLARDFEPDATAGVDRETRSFNERDDSMYRNFVWLMSRLPAGSKVIVWTATTHAAKDLSGVAGQERRVSLGSYIHREYQREAFVLGFSAYAGSYARAAQSVRPLEPATDSSVEARAFANSDTSTRYLDAARIRALGRIAARPLGTGFTTATWSEILDGLVIFREERPPQRF